MVVMQTEEIVFVYRGLDARGTDSPSNGSKFKSRIILFTLIQNPTAATHSKVWLTDVRQARQYKQNYSIITPDPQRMESTGSACLRGSMLVTYRCNAILISF